MDAAHLKLEAAEAMKRSMNKTVDATEQRYRQNRIRHWDMVAPHKTRPKRPGDSYHRFLKHYCRFIVPEGQRVLEIGSGPGDLLAALKPSFGMGIDFSSEMIREASARHPELWFVRADAHALPIDTTFDVIILSDLVNDLWDVQCVFEQLRPLCHPGTRLLINFYNNLWRIPLSVVKRLGLGADTLEQNWLTPHDTANLLKLAGFDIIRNFPCILAPFSVRYLSSFVNRILAHLPPFKWAALTNLIIARPAPRVSQEGGHHPSVSVIVPASNEAGNIEPLLKRLPDSMGDVEVIFVEGHSQDQTFEAIQKIIARHPDKKYRLYRQPGKGKKDAVLLGFAKAQGDILMILDADMTVPPEDLLRFYEALVSGKGDFINGVRLVYPLEKMAMRFFNMVGNKFFSLAFTWLLGQPIKDTLCGTKVLWRKDYALIQKNRGYFGDFDPFGDFDLLFGAVKLNLKIVEMPIRYRARIYGSTNIQRWRHGWLLIKMVVFAARRIKFI